MGKILIFLALGLVAADKLDRLYLPPLGAKLSGGNPEDLQTPFELPKNVLGASATPTFVQDKITLRSGYVDESNAGPNVGQIIGVTSGLINPQTLYTISSPVTAHAYFPATYSIESDFKKSKTPLDINQEYINNYSFQQDPNLHSSVPKTLPTGILTGVSQDFAPTYQYPLDIPYSDAKSGKPSASRKAIHVNKYKQDPVFDSQEFNTQNEGTNQDTQDNATRDENIDQETIVSSVEMFQYPGRNFMPIKKNHQSNGTFNRIQLPNVQIMHDDFVPPTSPVITNLNSEIIKSNINTRLETPETIDSSSFVKSEPLAPTSTSRISPNRTKSRPERPQADADRNAVVLKYQNVITPEGYSYSYDTSNGISINESGTTNGGVRAQGAYSYTGDDGKVYRVVYTADENGFVPRGDHLPLVPEAIQRLIEKAAREKEAGIFDDGSYDEAKYGHKKYEGVMERYHPEYQGFTNDDMNGYNDTPRTLTSGNGIRKPLKTIPALIKLKDDSSGGNDDSYNLNENLQQQGHPAILPPNIEGEINKKTIDNSFTRVVPQVFTSTAIENKRVGVLFKENVNRTSFPNKEVTDIPQIENRLKQNTGSQSKLTNFVIKPSMYSLREENPDTIENSNAYNLNTAPVNKANGYFYTTPQNRFMENGNQFINKFPNPLNMDQELEIGDDDIITITVPSPDTLTLPDNTIITSNPYNNQYALKKLLNTQNNVNQEVNDPEHSNVSTHKEDSTTMPLNDNVPPKELSDPISQNEHVIPIKLADDSGTRKFTNIEIPGDQIFQGYGTPNIVVDEIGRPVTAVNYKYLQGFSMVPRFYGQNPNMRVMDLGNHFSNTDTRNSETDDESNIPNLGDYQNDYFKSTKPINSQNSDGTLETTAKPIIGEDFTGPKRPQTFDAQTGYFY